MKILERLAYVMACYNVAAGYTNDLHAVEALAEEALCEL